MRTRPAFSGLIGLIGLIGRFSSVAAILAGGPVAAAEGGPDRSDGPDGPGDPGGVAVSYLIDVARGRVSLEPGGGTAIIDSSGRKLAEIRGLLAGLEDELADGKLEALETRVLDDAAAVIVTRHVAFDLSRISVHPVGLLKRDGRWLPAPVPGSFENTGISYSPGIARQARELEAWMARQREQRIVDLREKLREKLRQGIAETITPEKLAALSPEELVFTFIRARQTGDLHLALACLGGLEQPPPPDWDKVLQRTTRGFHRPAGESPRWSELSARGRIRCVVSTDPGDPLTIVSVGSINPLERSPEVRIRHYTVLKTTAGTQRLRFPPWLASMEEDPEEADPIDAPLAEAFAGSLLARHPAESFADPQALARSFCASLGQDDFLATLPHLTKATGAEADRLLDEVRRLWREARNSRDLPPMLLGIEQEGATAVAFLCPVEPGNSRIKRHQVELVRLDQGPSGWLVAGRIPATGSTGLDEPLAGRIGEARLRREPEWLRHLGLVAPNPREGGEVAEAPLETLAGNWVAALENRDLAAMIRCVAAGDGREAAEDLMESLGNEIASNRRPELGSVQRAGPWAAIIVHFSAEDEESLDLLYPVLETTAGPRILVGETLFRPDSRTRKFLNRSSWKLLEERFDPEKLEGLRSIYDRFRRSEPETPPSK